MSEQIIAPVLKNNGKVTLYRDCYHCAHAYKKPSGLQIGQWLAECREAPPLQLVIPAPNNNLNIITQWPIVGDKFGFFCSRFSEKKGGY